MKGLSKDSATSHEVGEDGAGQRVDNYLVRHLKGVPKSHVYRILRSGEVRVNSARVQPDYRLSVGDRVRVPPVATAHRAGAPAPPIVHSPWLRERILHEDEALLVLDKPAGVAVHGGSGVSFGLIEQLRAERPQERFLELVHRLDRETSGVLLVAKKRLTLTDLHAQLREGRTKKCYLTLVKGRWRNEKQTVRLALHKYVAASGERRVRIAEDGQHAHTVFRLRRRWPDASLLEAELKTGRTHQIRVHVAHLGHPILGDAKYGDFALNKQVARDGLKRMFLHAWRISIVHPSTGKRMTFEAPLPPELARFTAALDARHAAAV